MTTRHPGRRLNGHRHRAHEDDNVGVIVGWSNGDPDATEQAKKQLHDTLIELMGTQRVGPVSWRIVKDRDRALGLLEDMSEGADQPHLDLYRQLTDLVYAHGGALIVTTAPGRPGWNYTHPDTKPQEKPAP